MTLLAAVLGLWVGVAVHVAVLRLPRRQPVWRCFSRCVSCPGPLVSRDLIPLVPFARWRGSCPACGRPLGWRGPVIELTVAALYAVAWSAFGPSPRLALALVLVPVLVAATAIDLEWQLLPDRLNLAAAVAGLALAAWAYGSPWTPLAGAVVGGGILALLAAAVPGGLGGGDVKFAAAFGLYLGPAGALLALLAAFTAAGAAGAVLLLTGRKRPRDMIPFGPFLALGAGVALFAGQAVGPWLAAA